MTSTTPTLQRPAWLGADVYPFTVRRLDLPSGTVAHTDEGEGPALLFVHAGMWSFVFRDVIWRTSVASRSTSPDTAWRPPPTRTSTCRR